MDTTTLLWTLAATVFAGIQLFISKIVAHERRDSAFNGLMMYGISGALAFFVLVLHPWPHAWLAVGFFGLCAGTIHSFGNYIRLESLKYIESVIFFPINKVLGPIIVVFAGVWWFGDSLSPTQYVGIACALTVPLLLLSAVEHHRQNNLRAGLTFLIASTFLTATSIIFTKEGLLREPDVFFMVGASQLAGTVCSASILFKQRGLRAMVAHIERRDITLGCITGLIGFISYFTLLKALSTGLVSIVYVIQAHYILIPIVLSVWWYGEHMNIRKAAAIVVSSLAIILLYK